MAIRDLYISGGIKAISYTGDSLGSLLELQVEVDNDIQTLHYNIDTGERIPKTAWGLFEQLTSFLAEQSALPSGYSHTYKVKATLVDHHAAPTSGWQTITSNLFPLGNNNTAFATNAFALLLNITDGIGNSTINVEFYSQSWISPFLSSGINDYFYNGPLLNFSEYLDCICKAASILNLGPQLRTLLTEIEEKVNEYAGTPPPTSTSICDQATKIRNTITNSIDGKPMDRRQYAILEEAEKLFLELISLLRNLLWNSASSGEYNCNWNNFSKEVNTFQKKIYIQACGMPLSSTIPANSNISGIPQGIHLRWQAPSLLSGRAFSQKQGAFSTPVYYGNAKPTLDNALKIYRKIYNDTTWQKTEWDRTHTYGVIAGSMLISREFRSSFTWKFLNSSAFSAITTPPAHLFDYLRVYDDYIEITFDKLCFAFELKFDVSAGSHVMLRVETISKNHINDQNILSSREEILVNNLGGQNPATRVYRNENENITKIRFRFTDNLGAMTSGFSLTSFTYETYTDFYTAHPLKDWTFIQKAVLSLDNNEVLNNRLKKASVVINKLWPKYKENIVLNESNYVNKWYDNSKTGIYKGLRDLVLNYFKRETVSLTQENTQSEFTPEKFIQSPENLLNFTAMDYHVARMIGLGTIDITPTPVVAGKTDRFIYLAYYEDRRSFHKVQEIIQYMTLPTGEHDYRTPLKPEIYETYGIDSGCEPFEHFDEEGYSRTEKLRYINLNRNLLPYEKDFSTFFSNPTELYNLGLNTMPTMFGMLYEHPEPGFNVNEITNDETDYEDEQKIAGSTPIAVRETVPLINKQNPLFTHKHLINGDYEYKLYGINWFGRTSQADSNLITINTNFITKFKGLLKPPSDIHAHYIQTENSLLFSTQAEQDALAARTGSDKVWTRLNFNWNHVQKISQQEFTELKVYFRESDSLLIRGAIKTVAISTGTVRQCDCVIENFSYKSSKTVRTSNVNDITSSNASSFIGALLKTENSDFKVLAVDVTDGVITLTLKAHLDELINQVGDNTFEKSCNYSYPSEGDYFTMQEDWTALDPITKEPNSLWQNLTETIPLTDLDSSNLNEEIVDGKAYKIGGILDSSATFTKYAVPTTGDPENNYDYSNDSAPFYFITFAAPLPLPTHTRLDMAWHKGVLRIYNATEAFYYDYEIATFEIVNVSGTNKIKIGIFDQNKYLETLTLTATIKVNYHPGYKVYLKPETGSGRLFNKTTIMPTLGQRVKQTYIALQAIYNDTNNSIIQSSELSTPIPLIALEERPVVQPAPPLGGLYAARPDFYKKSSYTFDSLLLSHNPYSFIVYRATGSALLEKLYNSSTITIILGELSIPAKKAYINNFYTDLVNGSIFDGSGNLKSYGASPNILTIPRPDKLWPTASNVPTLVADREKAIINALNDVFAPITRIPIVMSFLKEGKLTSNAEPKIKDLNGNFLDQDDPDFDPYPFAVKCQYGGNNYLRFTDYTLEGDTKDIYFYSISELGINNDISARSSAKGPIAVVNSAPPLTPTLKNIVVNTANPYLSEKPSVSFVLNKNTDSDVSAILLYRTFEESKSNNYGKMKLVGTFTLTDSVIDTFSDITKINLPINEPCYYRLVYQKDIQNEFDSNEKVDSLPSELITVTLSDSINPIAPLLTPDISGSNTNKDTLNDVTIQLTSSTYKGTYYLYLLNTSGNWQLIETLVNSANAPTLTFNLGNVLIKQDGEWINKQYKVVAENRSGLLSLDEKILNLTDFYVPKPSIIGSSTACTSQNKTYKTTKSNATNTLQWQDGGTNKGTAESQILNWARSGNKLVTLIETDVKSAISVTVTLGVVVKPLPTPAISGNIHIWNNTEEVYSTANLNGNFYLWNVNESEIVTGQNSNTITIKYANVGAKNISVQESNGGCIVASTNYPVIVYPKPNPIITGNDLTCSNKVDTYNLIYHPDNNIQIAVQSGTFIQINPTQIEVTWQNSGLNKIELTEFNTAGTITGELIVDVKPAPTNNINGNNMPLKGNIETYNVQSNNSNTLVWKVDNKFGTIVSGQDSPNVVIQWLSTGTIDIEVVESNEYCVVSFFLTVNIT